MGEHVDMNQHDKRKSEPVCRYCGAGVNPPERIHWWCRDLETKGK